MKPSASFAAELAARHPDQPLPCPVCAASVQGQNLSRHLERVHQLSGAPTAPEQWAGVDRTAARFALLPLIGLLGCMVLVALLLPPPWLAVVLGALFVLGLLLSIPLIASVAGKVPATVEIGEDGVTLLRWGGLLKRTVRFPAQLTRGRAFRTRSRLYDKRSDPVGWGVYVQLSSGGRRVRLHARHGTAAGKHWARSWQSGPRRQWVDVTVEPAALVALEHHLARRGELSLRED